MTALGILIVILICEPARAAIRSDRMAIERKAARIELYEIGLLNSFA
jgi:hypothetical protein